MGEIIEHDFGRREREAQDRFDRLMQLAADRRRDILADPVGAVNAACDRLAKIYHEIEVAKDALRYSTHGFFSKPEDPMAPRKPPILVEAADYDRMKTACETLERIETR